MPALEDDLPRRPSIRGSAATPLSTSHSDPTLDASDWRRLVDYHPDGIVVSVDASIRYANAAAAALLGVRDEEHLVDRSLFAFLPRESHQLIQQHRFLVECGEVPPPLDLVLPQPSAPDRAVLLRSAPTRLNGRYAMQTTLVDTTTQRAREQRLQAQKEEAEKANQLKSRFLAQMSHEIRTPLTSIIGFAEILNEGDLGEWGEFASHIERSSQRLLHTINSVLDLSRLEAGSLQLRPKTLAVGDVIRDAVEVFRPRAAQQGIQLHMEVPSPPLHARFDAQALDRILDNLIGNAIKFTAEGGRVSVRAHRATSNLRLEVEDTGVGIAPQFIPHLFKAFRQGDTSSRDAQAGSGLGLAITHQLVELMDGTIAVESEPEVGTRFTVTLPIESA